MEQTDSKCLVKKIDHMEIATSDIAKLEKLFEGFGFWTTQIRDNAEGLSKLMEQGHTKLLLTEGKAGSFAQSYSANHGDGVCRLAFTVADTVDAYKTAIERGAEGIEDPKVEKANNEIIAYFENMDKDGGPRTFFELSEKKFSKLFFHFQHMIKEFNFRNLIYFSLYSSIFLDYMYSLFNVKFSN